MKLTYSQIETLWTQNGGSKSMAAVMAAIALAESGGRTDAFNKKAPDYSVGLWQINYYGSMLAGRTKAYGSPEQLIADPNRQAKAAISILHGQGLKAWSTYTNGAYKNYLDKSAAASPLPSIPSTTTGASSTTSSVQPAALQQAGYDAVIDLTPWGIPLNPFKIPGWIQGQLNGAAGQAGGAIWDGLAPVLLASLGIATGAALLITGLYITVKPAADRETGQAAQLATLAA